MTTMFSDVFERVVGERIDAVETTGETGRAITIGPTVIRVTELHTPGDTSIAGRKIVASIRGNHERAWSLLLEDNTIVRMEVSEAETGPGKPKSP